MRNDGSCAPLGKEGLAFSETKWALACHWEAPPRLSAGVQTPVSLLQRP